MERKKSSVFSFLTGKERFVVQRELLGGLDKNMEQSSWSLWSHIKKEKMSASSYFIWVWEAGSALSPGILKVIGYTLNISSENTAP